jgi:hypothetical protein
MATTGSGYLIANDLLTEISFVLVEQLVQTTLGTAVAGAGIFTITPPNMSYIYNGAQLIVGAGDTQETITVSGVTPTTFAATFQFAHAGTEALYGATFPTCQTDNEFFDQTEVLNYLAEAENSYLMRVPAIMKVATVAFPSQKKVQPMPDDSIEIERVALEGVDTFGNPTRCPLWEEAVRNYDALTYRWEVTPPGNPRFWYQDRSGYREFGIGPSVPLNAVALETIYSQRDSPSLLLTDGFLLPDPLLHYVKYGAMATMFNKDGEQRDPARAKYCQQRFDMGVKIGTQFYDAVISQMSSGN